MARLRDALRGPAARPICAVAAILALVAVVAATSRADLAGGTPSEGWDLHGEAILAVLMPIGVLGGLALLLAGMLFRRRLPPARPSLRAQLKHLAGLLVFLLAVALIISRVRRERDGGQGGPAQPAAPGTLDTPSRDGAPGYVPGLEEWLIGGALALLLLIAAVWWLRRQGRLLAAPRDELAASLDVALSDSLDDLRREPDVRRAIVAAYARMERTLAAAGLPRHRSEAPLEYLDRVLVGLAVPRAATERLTELFELAKFSHHPLGEPAREDAIEALEAVREALREPEPAEVAA